MIRVDGRRPDELRPVSVTPNYLRYAEGSVLLEWGKNKVLCAVTMENRVPPYLIGSGSGWITAEYAMLPRSAKSRIERDGSRNKPNKRSIEIERLISRSLRACADLKALGERTLLVDCDVIESDGGTRTASITGGFIALGLAVQRMTELGQMGKGVLKHHLAAVSCGIVENTPVLDLNYLEDVQAQVDMNVVMTGDGRFVEVQGTAERQPFSRAEHEAMLALAESGIGQLIQFQKRYISLD